MQVQTDLINICALKLNSSSIASSTPGNNLSYPQGQIITFQQFNNDQYKNQKQNMGHKKRLTIQINDSYDYNNSSQQRSQINQSQSYINQKQLSNIHFFKKHDRNQQKNYGIGQSQSPSFANSNFQIDFHKIIHQNNLLIQKVKNLQNQLQKIKQINSAQMSSHMIIKCQNQNLKILLKKKEQQLLTQKQRNLRLNQKISQYQQQKQQKIFYDQKLRQKQNKIQDLQRKLDKITLINKSFQKQLKQSDKKIMQLQKDLQKTFCQNQHQTINRIKQSSIRIKQQSLKSKQLIIKEEKNKQNKQIKDIKQNKQNLNQNIMSSTIQMRKSLDKKKCSQSQGKKKQIPIQTIKGQRTSSTTNIVSKKLLVIKKQ